MRAPLPDRTAAAPSGPTSTLAAPHHPAARGSRPARSVPKTVRSKERPS
ncbi:hypothetical protein [Streptomyces sp. NPDC058382]